MHHPAALNTQIKHLSLALDDKKFKDKLPEEYGDILVKRNSGFCPLTNEGEKKNFLGAGNIQSDAFTQVMEYTSSVSPSKTNTHYLESSINLPSELCDILNDPELAKNTPLKSVLRDTHLQNHVMGHSNLMGIEALKKNAASPPVTLPGAKVFSLDPDFNSKNEIVTCKSSTENMEIDSVNNEAILKTGSQIYCESLAREENCSACSTWHSEWPHIPGAWENSNEVQNKTSNSECASKNWPVSLVNQLADRLSICAILTDNVQKDSTKDCISLESCGTESALKMSSNDLESVESESESIYCDAKEVVSDRLDLSSNPFSKNIKSPKSELSNIYSNTDSNTTVSQPCMAVSGSAEQQICRLDQPQLADERCKSRESFGNKNAQPGSFHAEKHQKNIDTEDESEVKSTQNMESKASSPALPVYLESIQPTREDGSINSGPLSGPRWNEYNLLHQQSLQKYREILSTPLNRKLPLSTDIHSENHYEKSFILEQKITSKLNSPVNSQGQENLNDNMNAFKQDTSMDRVSNLERFMCDSGELESAGNKNFSHPGRFRLRSPPLTKTMSHNIPGPGSSQNALKINPLSKVDELSSGLQSSDAALRLAAIVPASRFSYSSDEKVPFRPVSESRFSNSSDELSTPVSRVSKQSEKYEIIYSSDPSYLSDVEFVASSTTKSSKTLNLESNRVADNINYVQLGDNITHPTSLQASPKHLLERKGTLVSTILRRRKVNTRDTISKQRNRPNSMIERGNWFPSDSKKISYNANLDRDDVLNSDTWPLSASPTLNHRNIGKNIPRAYGDPSTPNNYKHNGGEISIGSPEMIFSKSARKKKLRALRRIFNLNE